MIRLIIKIGNLGISLITAVLALSFILYGTLSLWDMFRTENGAFVSEDLLKYRPDVFEKEPPYLDDLIKINEDTVGWITIYGTNIDYPIMQGETDLEYLNKDVFGDYSMSGSIFLSVLNKRDFSEPYQLIYGHHMENGSMFGDIDKFADKNYFDNNNGIRTKERSADGVLITQGRAFALNVFALMKTNAYDKIIYRADKNETETGELIEYVNENAVYIKDAGKIIHLLALSTCDSGSTDGRLVLLLKVSIRDQGADNNE